VRGARITTGLRREIKTNSGIHTQFLVFKKNHAVSNKALLRDFGCELLIFTQILIQNPTRRNLRVGKVQKTFFHNLSTTKTSVSAQINTGRFTLKILNLFIYS